MEFLAKPEKWELPAEKEFLLNYLASLLRKKGKLPSFIPWVSQVVKIILFACVHKSYTIDLPEFIPDIIAVIHVFKINLFQHIIGLLRCFGNIIAKRSYSQYPAPIRNNSIFYCGCS